MILIFTENESVNKMLYLYVICELSRSKKIKKSETIIRSPISRIEYLLDTEILDVNKSNNCDRSKQ